MPLINNNDVNQNFISYETWKTQAAYNRIWYTLNLVPIEYIAAFGKLGVILITKITEPSDISDFETTFLPTAFSVVDETELKELAQLDAQIGKSEGVQQKLYDISNSVSYVGYAPIGLSQESIGWTIKKTTFDSSGNPISETWTGVGMAKWTNRHFEIYH